MTTVVEILRKEANMYTVMLFSLFNSFARYVSKHRQ